MFTRSHSLALGCMLFSACLAMAGCRGCTPTQTTQVKPDNPKYVPTTNGSSTQPAPTAQGQAPVVTVQGNEAIYDLGPIAPSSKHTIIFVVDNPTDKRLQFRTVRGDCECIKAVNPPDGIDAQSSARITVEFVAPKEAIDYQSRVLIPTDDPARRLISLRVSSKAPTGQ